MQHPCNECRLSDCTSICIYSYTNPEDRSKDKALAVQVWTDLYSSWSLRIQEFLDSRSMKVVSLSAKRTGRLYLSGDNTGTNFWERLSQLKIPMTVWRIEPATFRLVGQHHRVPLRNLVHLAHVSLVTAIAFP